MSTRSGTPSGTPSEELRRLLERGPFADALRVAIAERGLSLGRLRDRLDRYGTGLSVATLSSWQSGRRRPERPESLRALRRLEAVLGVPEDGLRGLLEPARARGRRTLTERLPATAEVWAATRPEAAEVLAPFAGCADSGALRRLSVHDRVLVGPDGRAGEKHSRIVLRAEEDGPDRLLTVMDWGDGPRSPASVSRVRNCRVGRVAGHPRSGLVATELLFERPLRRGETLLVEYVCVRPRGPFGDGRMVGGDRSSRYFRGPVRECVLEVCFHPAALPVRCRQLTTRLGEVVPKAVRDLELNASGRVHAIGLDFGPGKFGISWHMADPGGSVESRPVAAAMSGAARQNCESLSRSDG
ncbi:helix-turn-helix transcriptional regulator [Streptomyces sp. NPDC047097]|uniref:helix-turn-helix domain-containing protein n=1 Tax=Streptomyces sp. NPDC047097 TaxID=3155260 RepID=UPI003409ACDC